MYWLTFGIYIRNVELSKTYIYVVVIEGKDEISIMNGPNISLPFSCFKSSIKNLYVTLEVSIKDSTYSFLVRV